MDPGDQCRAFFTAAQFASPAQILAMPPAGRPPAVYRRHPPLCPGDCVRVAAQSRWVRARDRPARAPSRPRGLQGDDRPECSGAAASWARGNGRARTLSWQWREGITARRFASTAKLAVQEGKIPYWSRPSGIIRSTSLLAPRLQGRQLCRSARGVHQSAGAIHARQRLGALRACRDIFARPG